MSNENSAIFEAFIAKCNSLYVVGGTFGETDVEISVQRHNDNKLQVSVGGLGSANALGLLDSLGIKLDAEEAPKEDKRLRKVKREAKKLAEEDVMEAAAEEEEESSPPKRRKRRTKAEIAAAEEAAAAAEAAAEEEEESSPPKRRKRRTKAEIAAAEEAAAAAEAAAEEEEEEVVVTPPPPPAKRRRSRRAEPEPVIEQFEESCIIGDDKDVFDIDKTKIEKLQDVEDVVEVVLDSLPDDVTIEKCIAAMLSVRDAGISQPLKGWNKAQIEAVVSACFE